MCMCVRLCLCPQTYELGLLLGEGLAQVGLLLLQGVPRGQRGPRVGHGGLAVLLLQGVGDHQEGPQADVHTLRITQVGSTRLSRTT